ncbi:antibiotic biosynthesis monooxygenase [Streptosporangium sp. NPDC000396]|uniref:antibiotic biosynthesis monooxygenase n=1 Tax=Streptosporangium sp. NPDC000396 TaxID=3366185 RepID=UPI00367E9CAF
MEPSVSGRNNGGGATVMISSKVRQGREEDYRRWQEKVNEAARKFEGFERTEVYPPDSGEHNTWVVVFRFSTIDRLTDWLNSEVRGKLLEEGRALLEEPAAQEVLARRAPAGEAVTVFISHKVRPGREEDYRRWQDRVRKAQEKFPGSMGFENFEPVAGIQDNWVVMFRFDTREHLDQWLESDTRKKLLEEGRNWFHDYHVRTIKSAFSGWFPFGATEEDGVPPNWKQAMAVLLALYPTVMVLSLTVGPRLAAAGLPGYIALFISNVLSTLALTWLLMPVVNKVFASWLAPARRASTRTNVTGAMVMVLCFALFIAAFGFITT